MSTITNFTQANKALKRFVPPKSVISNYKLDTMVKLMAHLGNPQDKLKIVHVAGTSGKTSTSYYVANLLHAAGHSTGLTVSPHIDEINERVQIDLKPLPEQEYCAELDEFIGLVNSSSLSPSHFEVMVAFAYWVFAKRHVDYAVVEVGLGGLLDGTNVVNRPDKVCVITDIGLDHTEILGNTLAEIAAQKAGIIHDGNMVFTHKQGREVMDVVQRTCHTQNATLNIVQDGTDDKYELPTFQRRNLLLARSAVEFVLQRDLRQTLNADQVAIAAQAYIPGRMEVITYKNKTLVLDGSHSEQKIKTLVSAMKQQFPGQDQDVTMLVSFGQNKQLTVNENIKLLRQLGTSIIITRFSKGQDEVRLSIEPGLLAEYAKNAGFKSIKIESNPLRALGLLVESRGEVGLITGSLYLLNDLHSVVLSAT